MTPLLSYMKTYPVLSTLIWLTNLALNQFRLRIVKTAPRTVSPSLTGAASTTMGLPLLRLVITSETATLPARASLM